MTADMIIVMLLIVATLMAGLMSFVAQQDVPGHEEYRPGSTQFDPNDYWQPEGGPDVRRTTSQRRSTGRGLGRGDDYESDHDYYRGKSHDGRTDRERRYGDDAATREGFEAWAKANGFWWQDRFSQSPPPPPEPPVTLHWSIVLDVPRSAGVREIRAAYGRTMRRLHPDVAPQNATTSQQCTDATEAYRTGRREAEIAGRP